MKSKISSSWRGCPATVDEVGDAEGKVGVAFLWTPPGLIRGWKKLNLNQTSGRQKGAWHSLWRKSYFDFVTSVEIKFPSTRPEWGLIWREMQGVLQPEIKTFPAHKISDRTEFFYHTFWQNLQQLELPGGSTGPWNTGSLENILVRLHRSNRHLFQIFKNSLRKNIFIWYLYWAPPGMRNGCEARLLDSWYPWTPVTSRTPTTIHNGSIFWNISIDKIHII